jgi:hypothetical protein
MRVERMCDVRLSYEVIVSKPTWYRDVNGRNSQVDRRVTGRNRLARFQLTRGIGSDDFPSSFTNEQPVSVKAGNSWPAEQLSVLRNILSIVIYHFLKERSVRAESGPYIFTFLPAYAHACEQFDGGDCAWSGLWPLFTELLGVLASFEPEQPVMVSVTIRAFLHRRLNPLLLFSPVTVGDDTVD